eukprot:COSAG04_NODE_6566_length_1303_cov_2.210133_1_plen_76_part_00
MLSTIWSMRVAPQMAVDTAGYAPVRAIGAGLLEECNPDVSNRRAVLTRPGQRQLRNGAVEWLLGPRGGGGERITD